MFDMAWQLSSGDPVQAYDLIHHASLLFSFFFFFINPKSEIQNP